jgi:4-amino-4-deoxy-L-arabinose transferase-like glycosyltransferase
MRAQWPLAAVLTLALALRVWALDFGLPHTLTRPDEDAVVSVALRFFQRNLNPGFFDWPSLFMYVVAAVYVLYFNIGRTLGWFPLERIFLESATLHPSPNYLIARGVSVATGVMTVWAVHRIGLKLFGRHTAIVAAFYIAVAALHVRDSHFGVTDIAATWLATMSFLFTVEYANTAAKRAWLWSALCAGLAASTKYNAGLIALPGLVVLLGGRVDIENLATRARRATVYAGVAALAFLAGTPYAVLDWRVFVTALEQISDHLRGGHMALSGPGWVIHLTSSLRYGLGLPLLMAGIAGLLLYLWRAPRAAVVFVAFPLVYFALIGVGQTAFARYILPIVPFLCLAAAYATTEGARWAVTAMARPAALRPLMGLLACLIAAPSVWSVVQTNRLLSRSDNRLLAAEWIRTEFPEGVTLHQTGSIYGHVQIRTIDALAPIRYREHTYDEAARVFRDSNGSPSRSLPEIIVVQQSPLGYSAVSEDIRRVLDESYEIRRTLPAVDSSDKRLVYDRDDAFFVPLAGFAAVTRPGPTFVIYARRRLNERTNGR